MKSGISRRVFLCAFPAVLVAQLKQPARKTKPLPVAGEFARIIDPVTENVIVRLTGLDSSSLLPDSCNRFVSARERLLIFSSDRSGHFAPYQIDLRTGALKMLADTAKLNTKSLSLDRTEKLLRYIDGDSLYELTLGRGAPHRLAEQISAFSVSPNGELFLVSRGKLIEMAGKESRVLADAVTDVWAQPSSGGCLFSRFTAPDECELHYLPKDASMKSVLLASGRIRKPFWDQGAESVIFLRDVTSPNGTVLAEIRGKSLNGSSEYLVSPTSQFASFAPNSDATVFVGASRSRAQPNLVLMLRSPHREMTLCEHRASHPGEVSPVFAPDNRRVYFQSDHEGHSAIYSVNVELLVEPPVSG